MIERTVHADLDDVFTAFADYTTHQSRMPRHFPSIRPRSRRGDVAIVETHMKLGKQELTYTAKHVSDRPNSHNIFFVGGDCKGSQIRAQFMPVQHGTKVRIRFELKLGIISQIRHMRNRYDVLYSAILDEMFRV